MQKDKNQRKMQIASSKHLLLYCWLEQQLNEHTSISSSLMSLFIQNITISL